MNLYAANDTVVQKVTPTGLIRLCPVASRLSDYCHNTLRTVSSSGLATTVLSNLNPPRATGDMMGGDGNLYATDRNSSSIYRVTLAGSRCYQPSIQCRWQWLIRSSMQSCVSIYLKQPSLAQSALRFQHAR